MDRIDIHEDKSLYPEDLIAMAKKPKYFGRMNSPTSSAYVKGPCGDEMELYLVIKDETIYDIKFYTEGCIATHVCGSMTASMALGKTVDEALGISPKKVIGLLNGLPKNHCHCAILVVTALYKAIADYLLKP